MANALSLIPARLRHRFNRAAGGVLARAPSRIRRGWINAAYAPYAGEFAGGKVALFDAVYFELRTRCNGTCAFCAASAKSDPRPDRVMSHELFSKLIGELQSLGYAGRVAFHVNNDPLIAPDLAAFVAEARRKLPKAWIQILTNGKALKNELGEKLIDAGIDELSINSYEDDPERPIPANIESFRKEVIERRFRPDQLSVGHGPFERPGLFAFNVFHRDRNEVLNSRGGTAPNKKIALDGNPFGFCIYPFTQLNITTDGRISKCCSDVFFDDPMGDASQETLLSIWNGKKFHDVRQALLANDRRQLTHCRDCDFLGVRASRRKRSWIEGVGFAALAQLSGAR